MSHKELDRHFVIKKIITKELTQIKGAEILGITDRQIRNLLKAFKLKGINGLISQKRGKPSNRKKNIYIKKRVIALIHERYEDFGPSLAAEKLAELHSIQLSDETIRQWMIEERLWTPKVKRRKFHLSRQRRECFGDLIQADGSKHHWFGEDLPRANLTVFIDDATSCLTSLYFSESETLSAYFKALEKHITKYGRPLAIYTDHFSVFEANNKTGITQMQRALKSLDINLILANSPQAKGRVERANRTLQDRLIKEMRLRGITTIEQANAFLPEFIEIYNKKFSKEPMSEVNTHRPLDGHDLKWILCRHESRTLLSGSIFQYNNKFYKVLPLENIRRMKGRKVDVITDEKGKIRVYLNDKELEVGVSGEKPEPQVTLNRKEVLDWKPCIKRNVSASHPWKRYGKQKRREERIRKEIKKYEKNMV